MKRAVSMLLVMAIVSITGFNDWNGNGQMDEGESFAEGVYMLNVTAADGAVSLTVVNFPPGQPYRLRVTDGDQVEAVSGCGVWSVDVAGSPLGAAVYVPVVCRAVFMPMVMD